jgi:hypothetical protein
MKEIHKERLRKVIDALRSEKYCKATGMLCDISDKRNPCFCVQGVCCDLFAQTPEGKELQLRWEKANYAPKVVFVGRNIDTSVSMPEVVQDYFGISYFRADTLLGWNDRENLSFPEIADRIEKWVNR